MANDWTLTIDTGSGQESTIYSTWAEVASAIASHQSDLLYAKITQNGTPAVLPTSFANLFKSFSVLQTVVFDGVDTSNITSLSNTFMYCSALSSLTGISNWDTSAVTTMDALFHSCSNLTSIDVSNWDTSNVTIMKYVFCNCSNLAAIDVSGWNTSKVTDINNMFNGCAQLSTIDVSNWDTANVTNMGYLFYGCSKVTSLDLSNWNTAKVTNMSSMLRNLTLVTSLDLSSFDTTNVTNMDAMLMGSRVSSLDLSNWNTAKVTNMSSMLRSCVNLVTVYASDLWSIASVTSGGSMFLGDTKIVGAISYDSSKTDYTYANWTTGYFTYKAGGTLLKVNMAAQMQQFTGGING